MNNGFTSFQPPEPMPASMFWWNHLSPEQQWFIKDVLRERDIECTISKEDFVTVAFLSRNDWHTMSGWPESIMRVV